jgi:putative heme-binding domain-containing protein
MRVWAHLAAAAMLWGQSRDTNPFTSAKDIAEGRKLYSYYCVFCHGMDGVSGRGAQLASAYRKHGSSDREMYRTIADGVPGTEMSGHWLEEDEIWKILSFVRVLEKSAAARPTGCEPGPGDAVRGKALFRGKGGCLACHHPASRLGPDLSSIGASHSRAHLRDSITHPAKEISRRYRVVSVKMKTGEAARGLLLNQGEYTVHLLDSQERIRSFARPDLADVAFPRESLMPSFRDALSTGELDDLVAYLCAAGSVK